MDLWKDTKRIKAQELIDWLLSAKTDSGWSVNWVNMVAFAELCSSSSHGKLTESYIMQVLKEMSTSNKKTVHDFEEIFEQKLKANAIAVTKHVGRWQFFIPIELTLSADIVAQRQKIRILGKDFSFLSLSSDAFLRQCLKSGINYTTK